MIASGGAGATRHCVEACLEAGAEAVLAASIFHRKEIEISEIKRAMAQAGVPVRL